MPEITIETIKRSANINGTKYPMYSGFISAEKMVKIADVPNFYKKKDHHQIASDIFKPPVDQWQRPLNEKKSNQIKRTYSDTVQDNLMANPVLIGIASLNIGKKADVEIEPKCISTSSGKKIVDNYFNITVRYTTEKKPLWILDGQHRIEGMKRSTQKENPVPFVLLYDEEVYTPPFLAEIFTYVTTKATPMKGLHAEWMKYSFGLDYYGQQAYKKSMDVVILLCKEAKFDGYANPFQNRIQFNPYISSDEYSAFKFNCEELVRIIAENYYGRGGSLGKEDLAKELVKSIKILEKLDSHSGNNSKLFSNDNPHKILAEGLLSGLLKNIKISGVKSKQQWESFYLDDVRSFDQCNWSLPFVKTTGALSSGNGPPSKKIAKECFDLAFNDPNVLNNNLLTDYLQGVGAKLNLIAYKKTKSGRKSKKDIHKETIKPGGLQPFNINKGGVKREIIRIEAESSNCYIRKVLDPEFNPKKPLKEATMKKGLDISNFSNHKEIEVLHMSYSGDTQKVTTVRLDQ